MVASDEWARVVRLVAVSPADVQAERDRLEAVVDELNRGVARERGCRLSLWRWETDAHPGLHLQGPQGLIDDAMRIEDADVVVGVFWKRFGTPTPDARSGTEHELRRAWSGWRQRRRPQVMVYFCERKHGPRNAAEAVHLQQLLSFREAMPKEQLWWRYTTVADFERAVREHLTAFLLALGPVKAPARQPAPALAVRRVRFGLPLALAHFTGRHAELAAIDEAFGVAHRAVVTQAITGSGGVGKSQVAARYVHQHADRYDVVAWIRAEDGGIGDLSELATELGLPAARLPPAQRAGRAVRWLSCCDERWLLVLDNVAAPEQLRDCCPSSGNGRVIVTTRDRALAQFGPALCVDVFDESTAVEYLLATSGRTSDRDGATRLARALGFLPLALSHAGAYCAAGTSFDDYLELLGALPVAELLDAHPEAPYAKTVASTWQVSIQAAEREAPLAGQVLTMAAHLAPDAIPRELFDELLDESPTPAGRKRLLDAFNALHRLNLAQVDDSALHVHRLLQKTVRDDPVLRAGNTAGLKALAAVAAAFPSGSDRPQTWPQCERLLPHALALSAAPLPPGAADEQLVCLLNSASVYLLYADQGVRAVDTATQANECAQQRLGAEHPHTLNACDNLVVAYSMTGRTKDAVELGERGLADCERLLGPESVHTLGAVAHLASADRDAGRLKDAIEFGERHVADSERILGPEDVHTLVGRANLAAFYNDAGRSEEATALSSESEHAVFERILGPEHPHTVIARHRLAAFYREAGCSDEAIELDRQVLADCARILGPQHPDTLQARDYLAVSYREAGRSDEAIALGEQVLAARERLLGVEHPDTLRARAHLAVSYRQAGAATMRSNVASASSPTASESSEPSTTTRYEPAPTLPPPIERQGAPATRSNLRSRSSPTASESSNPSNTTKRSPDGTSRIPSTLVVRGSPQRGEGPRLDVSYSETKAPDPAWPRTRGTFDRTRSSDRVPGEARRWERSRSS
jgi:tetratricopeptide (TPR) repeat protein